MTEYFSHLVWLGAGTATEPENLLNNAGTATLIEAREAACLLLKRQHQHKKVSVKQMILTVDGAPVEFTEYNLAEYSAIQAAASLKTLFPGIRALHGEQYESVAITEAINGLALEDNNNLLIVDIPDINLALLNALHENNQLGCFSEIHIQAGITPLYIGAATVSDITAFLHKQGFLLQQTNSQDPDLPWLIFEVNPLWQTLEQAQLTIGTLDAELVQVKQHLIATQNELNTVKKAAEKAQREASSQLEATGRTVTQADEELAKKAEDLAQQLLTQMHQTELLETERDQQAELIKSLEDTIAENTHRLSELSESNVFIESESEQKEQRERESLELMQLELEKTSKQLMRKTKQSKEQQEQLDELILLRKTLELDNRKLQARIEGFSEQLTRADAQYKFIKDLILSRGLKENEKK